MSRAQIAKISRRSHLGLADDQTTYFDDGQIPIDSGKVVGVPSLAELSSGRPRQLALSHCRENEYSPDGSRSFKAFTIPFSMTNS